MLADGATALLCNILEVFYAARAFSFQYKTIINYFIYYGGPRARQINDILQHVALIEIIRNDKYCF